MTQTKQPSEDYRKYGPIRTSELVQKPLEPLCIIFNPISKVFTRKPQHHHSIPKNTSDDTHTYKRSFELIYLH